MANERAQHVVGFVMCSLSRHGAQIGIFKSSPTQKCKLTRKHRQLHLSSSRG